MPAQNRRHPECLYSKYWVMSNEFLTFKMIVFKLNNMNFATIKYSYISIIIHKRNSYFCLLNLRQQNFQNKKLNMNTIVLKVKIHNSLLGIQTPRHTHLLHEQWFIVVTFSEIWSLVKTATFWYHIDCSIYLIVIYIAIQLTEMPQAHCCRALSIILYT